MTPTRTSVTPANNEERMGALRRTPPPEFAAALRERLRERVERPEYHDRPGSPFRVVATFIAGSLVAVALLAIPAVRAQAQAFLDLFRVVNFTAVPVDVARVASLGDRGLDLPTLLGQQAEYADPGDPVPYVNAELASDALGYPLKLPALLPQGLILTSIAVAPAREARITADTRLLQDVMDALAIGDLEAPAALNGQVVALRVPPVARVLYTSGNLEVAWLQARSPEVTLPTGVDLAGLGEIGLRIAGLTPREAHTLAQAIDWRDTLAVPVPAGASAFRQVEVHGRRGLIVASTDRADVRALMWAQDGFVYGISGGLTEQNLLLMADSVP